MFLERKNKKNTAGSRYKNSSKRLIPRNRKRKTKSLQNSLFLVTQAKECDSARGSVVDVISSLSAISEENAASSEETTASMQELNATINILAEEARKLKELAESMDNETQFFKL